ncbi:MAG: YbaB/EbfC family nucleoid-associated protein [Eubacterium sp.]|nr:YbaB/EbfC family nucleoid-associated protein [Eubacterium sp.]
MAKKGGFPGGGGMPANMGNLMKQAQKMQQQMQEAQEELEASEFTASAGGGVVEVTVSGNKEIKNIKIDPDVVDPEDVETLEDLVTAAVNEAIRKMEEQTQEEMSKITGGMGGLF